MGSSAENFDAWFRERLEHFEEPPRGTAWENIAENLGHTRKRRVMVFILRIAAGMALTLSLGLGYYYYTQHRGISVPPALTDNQLPQQPLNADEPEMAAADESTMATSVEKKNLPQDAATRSGNYTAANSFVVTPLATSLTAVSELVVLPADSAHSDKILVSLSSDLLPEIYALPACISQKHEIPGLSGRQGSIRSNPISETDLIVLENLAQRNAGDEEKNRHRNWIIGGQMAPLYSYRNLSSDYMGDQDLNTLNNSEKGIMAYAGGISFSYKPLKRLSIESGIYYSKYGQEKTDIQAIAIKRYPVLDNYETGVPDGSETYIQVTITNSTGVITDQGSGGTKFFDSDNTITQGEATKANVLNIPSGTAGENLQASDDLTAYQYFEYLEIPLIVKYKVIDRKLDFNLMGGISTNFLTGNSIKIADDGKKVDFGETDDIEKVNYAGSVGIGFEYPVLANLLLNIEPKFRYYLNPIDKSMNLNVYPYSFGLFAGISYVF